MTHGQIVLLREDLGLGRVWATKGQIVLLREDLGLGRVWATKVWA